MTGKVGLKGRAFFADLWPFCLREKTGVAMQQGELFDQFIMLQKSSVIARKANFRKA